jgi:hypothetical protein
MAKCRCRFLVPTNYNDGSPVEPEVMIEIKMALDRQFGGYRIVAPNEGSWHGQIEATHEIEVCVLPKNVPKLREVVIEIGRRLGQKAMYFDAPPPSVEIIDMETGRDEGDEEEGDGEEGVEGEEDEGEEDKEGDSGD